jgi:hypothetical protein
MVGPWHGAIGTLGVLVAALLGFGAVQELLVRGIRGGEVQPLLVGVGGTLVSVMLALAALAWWRRRAGARRIAVVAALAVIVFHTYAALPPHRNVGLLALTMAVTYSLALLVVALRRPAEPRVGGLDPAA